MVPCERSRPSGNSIAILGFGHRGYAKRALTGAGRVVAPCRGLRALRALAPGYANRALRALLRACKRDYQTQLFQLLNVLLEYGFCPRRWGPGFSY